MTARQFSERLGNVDDRYVLSAQEALGYGTAPAAARPRRKNIRRIIMLAAVVCVLLGLTAVAAVSDWFGLRDLLLPQQEVMVPLDPETEAPATAERETYMADIISLAGYGDTPESQAVAEWQAFLNSYDTDGDIIYQIGNEPTGFEEDYGLYLVYTQEMADKLDEITAKYGLKLHTSMLVLQPGGQLAEQVGGDFLGENRDYSAYMYEDGTFKFDGEIDLEDYGHLDYQFQRCVRGSFSDVILNIVDINDYTEWVYITKSGVPVTLALAPRKALIIADLPDSFVTVNVLAGTETPTDDIFSHGPFGAQDLERFADSFDFSVLTPARAATPEQLDLAEQQKAELEAASRFYELTGLEQWQAQEFFASFANCIEADDRQAVAEMLYYPSTVTWWNTTTAGTHMVYETVEKAEDFLPLYDEIFTEDLWWNCIMANRYSEERADLIPDNGMVGAAGGTIWFMPTADGLRVVTIQNNEGNSVRMTEESGDDFAAAAQTQYGSAREAYTDILHTLLYEHVFPDGMLYDTLGDSPADRFAIIDMTGDGTEELILLATNSYTAGQAGYVLSWDEETGTIQIRLCEYPSFTFYDNGYLQAWASHNQGAAGDALWPYTLYRYDTETETYQPVAMVDAWDSSLTERYYDMFFPRDVDRSGTGVVYYVMTEGEYDLSSPMDAADYEAWLDAQIGGAGELAPDYQPLTEENIRRLTEAQ